MKMVCEGLATGGEDATVGSNSNYMDLFHGVIKKLSRHEEEIRHHSPLVRYGLEHFHRDAPKIVHLYIPVLICTFFVLVSVAYLDYYRVPVTSLDAAEILPRDNLQVDHLLVKGPTRVPLSKQFYRPSKVDKKDTFANIWIILAAICLIFLFLLFGTLSLLVLLKLGYSRIINCVSMIPYVVYLGVFPLVYIQELFYTLNVAIDWFVVAFFLHNQVVVGFIVLFGQSPKWIKQAYHILISGMLALLIIKFANEYLEVALMVLLICWDLYAVLHRKGPLNQLLNTLQASKDGHNLPPVVFQMTTWRQVHPKAGPDQTSSDRVSPQRMAASALDHFEIGLGDFIFYSVLVAKSFIYAGPLGAIFSLVSLIMGLTLTLMLLIAYGRALPAIPIPVTMALVAQLMTQFVLAPFAEKLNWVIILL